MALDDADISAFIAQESESALNYQDTNFQAERLKATDYYLGEPFGNEEDGRSQVVSRDLAEAVDSLMPALMRIFSSSDYVKYSPRNPEDEQAAEQATDLANYILSVENGGFRMMHDWFKSSLLYKVGVIRVAWNERESVEEKEYKGLTQLELGALLADDTVDIIEQEAEIITEAILDDEGGEIMPAVQSFDVKIKRRVTKGRVLLDHVPPEELLIDGRAKTLDEARFVAHRTEMPISDLVAMGFDKDVVESYGGYRDITLDQEKQKRFQNLNSYRDDPADPTQERVLFQESFIRIDQDEDGISEMRRVCTIGDNYEVLENQITDVIPFAMLSPILMPHRVIGQSISEKMFDLQLTKSAVLRQVLDNLYLTNSSRVLAVEGATNLSDLMTSRPGGIVRVRQQGAVTPLNVQPVGREGLAMLNYMDQVKEQRTGLSRASLGLDADALQSSTASAVAATVQAAAANVELIARVFAETGVTDLFKLILRMVTTYQDQPKTIRIRNKFVEVEPRGWNAEMDVVVNVGLGTGQTAEKMAFLGQVAGKQEQILQTLGAQNPLCDLSQYAGTLAKMVEMAGFKDTQAFFNPPARVQEVTQQLAAQAAEQQQQPQLDPVVAAEIQRSQIKLEADIALAREKAAAELELKREIAMQELELRRSELIEEAKIEAVKVAANLPGGQGNIPAV